MRSSMRSAKPSAIVRTASMSVLAIAPVLGVLLGPVASVERAWLGASFVVAIAVALAPWAGARVLLGTFIGVLLCCLTRSASGFDTEVAFGLAYDLFEVVVVVALLRKWGSRTPGKDLPVRALGLWLVVLVPVVVEGPDGNLWAGDRVEGLTSFAPISVSASTPTIVRESFFPQGPFDGKFSMLEFDDAGDLWLGGIPGTDQGFYRFDREGKMFLSKQ